MNNLRLFYAHVTLHWGFVVRIPGATAAQPALAIAPPTTVVGAFAAPLLRALGFRDGILASFGRPEMQGPLSSVFECILKATKAASMGLYPRREGPGVGVIMEPLRLIAAPYKTGGERRKFEYRPLTLEFYSDAIPSALPVQAVGAAYGPSTLIDLLWIVDVESLVDCLPGNIRVEDIDDLGLKASYGATRLGSKEGICSVLAACYLKELSMKNAGERFRAYTYIPAHCVKPVDPELTSKVQLWDLNYELTDYYVPAKTSPSLAYPPIDNKDLLPFYELTNKCIAYYIDPKRLPETCSILKEIWGVEWAIAVGLRG